MSRVAARADLSSKMKNLCRRASYLTLHLGHGPELPGGVMSVRAATQPCDPAPPRLDRPETANQLAGRSPPSKADRVRGGNPTRAFTARATGRGPITSDVDYRTRSPPRPGAGHRVGIQNPPAGRPSALRTFLVRCFLCFFEELFTVFITSYPDGTPQPPANRYKTPACARTLAPLRHRLRSRIHSTPRSGSPRPRFHH